MDKLKHEVSKRTGQIQVLFPRSGPELIIYALTERPKVLTAGSLKSIGLALWAAQMVEASKATIGRSMKRVGT